MRVKSYAKQFSKLTTMDNVMKTQDDLGRQLGKVFVNGLKMHTIAEVCKNSDLSRSLTDKSGVYLIYDAEGKLMTIGESGAEPSKTWDLKKRLRQYTHSSDKGRKDLGVTPEEVKENFQFRVRLFDDPEMIAQWANRLKLAMDPQFI
ncbi:hypothetical protein IV38_GL000067 [Lactobacillus selangorensis]|uniref:GIY-YIG domain-containing protein n=1 Tax=Lactobacillus selangorensis TaxID=81857 RepID=A0A0R2FKQ2_9LACO|nr:hypothetical protein [Lactobacillus selangorensis]KRN29187.1 hypothetical protein IV38_GL000067 [Lactobacillus selangorensis]KRN31455.1 hypothetical protein IV40_GL001451 [Lactobacillus selangorensis]